MRYYRLYLVFVFSFIVSCDNKQKKEKTIITNYQRLGEAMNGCFKKPTDSLFNIKVKEIFNVDPSSSIKKTLSTGALGMFPEEIVKGYNYVIPIDLEPGIPAQNEWTKLDKSSIDKILESASKTLCNYNHMLFYSDSLSTTWVLENYPSALISIVSDYGYTGNEKWLEFVFRNSSFKSGSDDPQLINLLFDFECKKPVGVGDCGGGQYTMRQDMIDKMIQMNFTSDQIFDITYTIKDSPEKFTGDQDKLYLYFMALSYKFTDQSGLMYFFDGHRKYFKDFKSFNYFEIEGFKHFIENFEMPKKQGYGIGLFEPDPYKGYGVINDPDGFTNLREGKGTTFPIVKKIVKGEKFAIEMNDDDWWLVVLADETRGWIHKSRVKIIPE